jgi:flagellar biosynthetic protein FliQ
MSHAVRVRSFAGAQDDSAGGFAVSTLQRIDEALAEGILMNELFALEMGRNALMMTVMLAAPMMATALLVGLLISIFQALTQINEQTMTFVPKILAVFGALLVTGPWMMQSMVSYASNMFSLLPQMTR